MSTPQEIMPYIAEKEDQWIDKTSKHGALIGMINDICPILILVAYFIISFTTRAFFPIKLSAFVFSVPILSFFIKTGRVKNNKTVDKIKKIRICTAKGIGNRPRKIMIAAPSANQRVVSPIVKISIKVKITTKANQNQLMFCKINSIMRILYNNYTKFEKKEIIKNSTESTWNKRNIPS